MNRREFINTMAVELSKISRDEAEDIIAYYNEYLDDAGIENEQQALEELGNPSKIAAQIKADYAVKQMDRASFRKSGRAQENVRYDQNGQPVPPKKGISVIWWVILGIFAAPVALPLAFAAGVLVIALFIVLGAFIFSLLVAAAAIFAGGIACVIAGFAILFVDFANAIVAIGLGFLTIGLALLLGTAIVLVSRMLFRFITRKINESRQRKTAEKQAGIAKMEGAEKND